MYNNFEEIIAKSDLTVRKTSCPKCYGTGQHIPVGSYAVFKCDNCYGTGQVKIIPAKRRYEGCE